MKWIAAAAAGVLIVLGFLLWEVTRDGEAKPAGDPSPPRADVSPDAPAWVTAPTTPAADAARPAIDAEPGVFVVKSEEFWDRVDDYSHRLLGYVSDCYEGGKKRKAKLKVTYQLSIVNHVVTLRDIKIVKNTINDPRLEQCMVRSLEHATFDDREMPDYLSNSDDPEEMLIRIEALKPFLPEQENGMK